MIVEHNKLEKLIEQQFGDSGSFDFGENDDFDLDNVDVATTDTNNTTEDEDTNNQEESPIVKYINKLFF